MEVDKIRGKQLTEILSLAAINYSNFKMDQDKFNLFYQMLSDIDINVLKTVMLAHIASSPFPPTIADLRKGATTITESNTSKIDAVNAWGEVARALRKYGMYNEVEALQSLSPLTAKVVKCMGWKDICCSDKMGVERGQFIKLYNNYKERLFSEKQLPDFVLKKIQTYKVEANTTQTVLLPSNNAPIEDNIKIDKKENFNENLAKIKGILNSLKQNKK